MSNTAYIRDRLTTVFTPEQADALTDLYTATRLGLATSVDMQELRDVVKDLAEAQRGTDQELAAFRKEYAEDRQASQREFEAFRKESIEARRATDQELAAFRKEYAEDRQASQRELEAFRKESIEARRATDQELAALRKESAEARRIAEQDWADIRQGQKRLDEKMAELAEAMRVSFIRHDRADGWLYELLLDRRLPTYVGREIRRCRVLDVQKLIGDLKKTDAAEALTEAEIDDLWQTDIVATGLMDGEAIYLIGEISCTGDKEDTLRAARRAALVHKVGKRAIPFLACHDIRPAAAEFARRQGVRVLKRGNLLPAAG